jgi:hypothetical protein
MLSRGWPGIVARTSRAFVPASPTSNPAAFARGAPCTAAEATLLHLSGPVGSFGFGLAALAERISHSHPALTVAGITRIEHHCGTCSDRDAAALFFRFTCSHNSADTAPIFPGQ